MKKNFLGFIILLLLVFVGAILLLDFTDNAPEALLKKTVYTLYSDTGTGYYEAPGGKEVNVLYLEEPAAPEDMPEKKAGERWLGYGEVKVEKPVDGWSKVDIGDGGVPLYVQEDNLYVQDVPMFEGRKVGNAFMSTGLRNVPPLWMMWAMSFALYFLLLMPCHILYHHVFKNNYVYTSSGAKRMGIQFRLMSFAALVYFVLLLTAQYLCGFNLDNNWFVCANYLGSVLWVIFNIIVGLVGAAALGFSLLLFLMHCRRNAGSLGRLVLNIGFSGLWLLVAGFYFVLVFLGVLVGVLVVGFFVVGLFKVLCTPSSGGYGVQEAPDPSHICGLCVRYGQPICKMGHFVDNRSQQGCTDFSWK